MTYYRIATPRGEGDYRTDLDSDRYAPESSTRSGNYGYSQGPAARQEFVDLRRMRDSLPSVSPRPSPQPQYSQSPYPRPPFPLPPFQQRQYPPPPSQPSIREPVYREPSRPPLSYIPPRIERDAYSGGSGGPISRPRPLSVLVPATAPNLYEDSRFAPSVPSDFARRSSVDVPPPPQFIPRFSERPPTTGRRNSYNYPESPITPLPQGTSTDSSRSRFSFTSGDDDLLPRPQGRMSRATHAGNHPNMGETFTARMAGALPVQLTNVSVDMIAKLAIDAIGGNSHSGRVATGTLMIAGISFGMETLMHMAMTAITHFPPMSRKIESVLKSGDLPKREVLSRIATLSAVLSMLGESWPIRLGADTLMKLERHDPITAVGTIKAGAGDIVGQLASLGVISASVYALYKTQPAFRAHADKMVRDAQDGLATLRERLAQRSESTRSGDRIELGSMRPRDSLSIRRPRR